MDEFAIKWIGSFIQSHLENKEKYKKMQYAQGYMKALEDVKDILDVVKEVKEAKTETQTV